MRSTGQTRPRSSAGSRRRGMRVSMTGAVVGMRLLLAAGAATVLGLAVAAPAGAQSQYSGTVNTSDRTLTQLPFAFDTTTCGSPVGPSGTLSGTPIRYDQFAFRNNATTPACVGIVDLYSGTCSNSDFPPAPLLDVSVAPVVPPGGTVADALLGSDPLSPCHEGSGVHQFTLGGRQPFVELVGVTRPDIDYQLTISGSNVVPVLLASVSNAALG